MTIMSLTTKGLPVDEIEVIVSTSSVFTHRRHRMKDANHNFNNYNILGISTCKKEEIKELIDFLTDVYNSVEE